MVTSLWRRLGSCLKWCDWPDNSQNSVPGPGPSPSLSLFLLPGGDSQSQVEGLSWRFWSFFVLFVHLGFFETRSGTSSDPPPPAFAS